MLNVIFFRTEAGREPVREWLRGLDKADKQRIGVDIEKVQFRWPVSMPLVRKMETDLWEIRSNLRNGFIKKTQRTPQRDLRLARRRRDMWREERII